MNIVEQWEREDLLASRAEEIFLGMMKDEREITDVFLSGGLAPVWLIKLLVYVEPLETDAQFHKAVEGIGTGDLFKALFAAKEMRNCIVKALSERAYNLAQRT